MAYLINRNVSGRLPCLHGICSYLVNQFGDQEFTIRDLKYDESKKYNIHDFSPCAVKLNGTDYITCRYLDNPFSPAKCAIVQSVEYDPQKSKLASDIMNSLDGLNLVDRSGSTASLTKNGKRFASAKLGSGEWYEIVRESVMSYGPFVGMIYMAKINSINGYIERRDLDGLGYPTTEESITRNGDIILLSTGSQADTMTRTRSVLLVYAIVSGIFCSDSIKDPIEYAMSTNWDINKFKVDFDLIPSKHYVSKPLSYKKLTKNTRSLRERGQSAVRNATVEAEYKMNNRRLVIVYILNEASEKSVSVKYNNLIKALLEHPDYFVIDQSQFKSVMLSDLPISFVAGIPYEVHEGNIITPLTTLNKEVLLEEVDQNLISILRAIASDEMIYEY